MPTQKHPHIAALIAAAATMASIAEPVSTAVMEMIGRAECERLGRKPDDRVNMSSYCGGLTSPFWRVAAIAALISHNAEQAKLAKLETLERAAGLAPEVGTHVHEMACGYEAAWYEITELLQIEAQPIPPKEVHEMIVMPRLRALVYGRPS